MKKLLNKSLNRIGRKFFTKRSDFFERFEKLKQERELTKEKYINENESFLNEEEENEEIKKYKEELKEKFYSETEYVNSYKKSQNDENKKKVDQFFENEKTLKEKINDYLGKSLDSKTEFLKKSEKLINSKKDFPTFLKNINEDSDYLDDYDRYDYYKDNYVEQESNSKMKQRDENKFMRRDEQEFLKKGLNKFYETLDEKIEKNDPKLTAHSADAKLLLKAEQERLYNKRNEKNLREEEEVRFPKDDEFISDEFLERLETESSKFKDPEYINNTKNYEKDYFSQMDINSIQEEEIEEQLNNNENLGFSLRAQFQIYLFYMEGWKIRDISLRFGATPTLIKATIWNLQYFFEDILPEITIKEACYLLSLEENKVHPSKRVDYGVNLKEMRKQEVGYINMEFPRQTLNHIPKNTHQNKLSQEEIDKAVEKFKKKKEDIVNENYVTKGVENYLIQNWVVHRGKGAIKVNRTFREIVERSHYKGYHKKNVKKRLDQGPRIAAQGFGYK